MLQVNDEATQPLEVLTYENLKPKWTRQEE